MTAAARYFARLEPVAYADTENGGVLEALAAALTAPREVLEVAHQDDAHEHPWGALLDPDATPAVLLDWLAVFAGIELPPSALTEAEKRYRIKQAAGRYRGTPRAVVEELQLVLTGTKTVLLGFHAPDEWHYIVGTIDTETPDPAAVIRAVSAQKPVGMIVETVMTGDWSSFVLAPDLVAHRETIDGVDTYVIGTPEYPTCQSVLDAFATCQDLLDNNPI